jgi:hypothetical protein
MNVSDGAALYPLADSSDYVYTLSPYYDKEVTCA